MSNRPNFISKFQGNVLEIASGSVQNITILFTNFSPSTIDLMNMPTEPGTVTARISNLDNLPLFAKGTYTVTNCIIDDDGEIVETSFVWNFVNDNNTCGLALIEFTINDNTACDYYYVPSDIYTPISVFSSVNGNENVDPSSSVSTLFPIAFSAISFFGLIQQVTPTLSATAFFVKIGFNDGSINDVCVMMTFYVNGIQFKSGLSLSYLKTLDPDKMSRKEKFSLILLEYILDFVNNLIAGYSTRQIADIPIDGIPLQTTMNGADIDVLLILASNKTSPGFINEDGVVILVLILVNPNKTLYSNDFFSQST